MRLGVGAGIMAIIVATACRSGTDRSPWTVSIRGYGPIAAGMTIAQASATGGRVIASPVAGLESCDLVGFTDDSSSAVRFMVVDGRIARVDITSPEIRTNHGAAVGDSEIRIPELYPERVTVRPHKYTDGHYLIVAPGSPADSGLELVFETDGKRVTEYRAGRLPEVEFVEGCS